MARKNNVDDNKNASFEQMLAAIKSKNTSLSANEEAQTGNQVEPEQTKPPFAGNEKNGEAASSKTDTSEAVVKKEPVKPANKSVKINPEDSKKTANGREQKKTSFMENVVPLKEVTGKKTKGNRFTNEIKEELEEDTTQNKTYEAPAGKVKKTSSLQKSEPVKALMKNKQDKKEIKKTELEDKFSLAKKRINSVLDNDFKRRTALFLSLFVLGMYTLGFIINLMKLKVVINPVTNIMTVLGNGEAIKVLLVITAVALAIILFKFLGRSKINYEDDRKIDFVDSDLYGSSGWMTREKRKKCLEIKNNAYETDGFILGKEKKTGRIIAFPWDSKLNRNFFICGNQGSWKSWGYARCLIMQLAKHGESVIVADPKGELYQDTALYLKEQGYVVKQFNLKDHMASDAWNCLADLTDDDVPIFCDAVIRNTLEKGKGWDPFYDGNDLNLLKALVFYVKHNQDIPEEEKTLATAYNLLLKTYEVSELDNMFASLDRNHPGRMAYSLFKSEKIKENTIGALGTRLQIFQNKKIQQLISNSDIDLTLPGKQKCAYFLIKSDQNETYDVLGTLFISYLFIKIVEYADSKKEQHTDVPVHFLLDEFSQLGEIMGYKKKFSVVRSRGIGISMLVQSIPQVWDRYTEYEAAEFIGGCDTVLFLGGQDNYTTEYFSKMTGEITIKASTERRNRNALSLIQYTPEYAESEGFGKRRLMTADEISRLKDEEENTALIFIAGQKPLMADKFGFHEHPVYKSWGGDLASHQYHPTDHVPEWVEEMKEKTNFQMETGGLYNMMPFPYYFEERFENWRKESFAEIEKGNPAFDRRTKKITLTGKRKLETLIAELNMEQSEDVTEYITRTLETGLMDKKSFEEMYEIRTHKEEKRAAKRQELINKAARTGAPVNSGSSFTGNDSNVKPVNENSERKAPQADESLTAIMNNLRTTSEAKAANESSKHHEPSSSETPEPKTTTKTLDLTVVQGGRKKQEGLNLSPQKKEAPEKKTDNTQKKDEMGVMDIFNQLKNGN